MRRLVLIVLFGMVAACAQNQRAQPAGSSASPNDPSASAGATAGSSKEPGDTQARPDYSNPQDKAPVARPKY